MRKIGTRGSHIYYLLSGILNRSLLGFSPFELVYGHTVRGPLKLLKEKWLGPETETSLLDYVSEFKERISQAWTMARENLKVSQTKMKTKYDKHSKSRVFKPGDKVLVLLPIPGQPLRAILAYLRLSKRSMVLITSSKPQVDARANSSATSI